MKCSNCGREIRETAKVCGYCGQKVQKSLQACPECGKEIREGAKICGYCGHRLIADAPPKPANAITTKPEVKQAKPQKEKTTNKPEPAQAKVKTVDAATKPEVKSEAGTSKKSEIKKERSKETASTKKRFPAWTWLVGAVVVIAVGAYAAFQFFLTEKLPEPVTAIWPNGEVTSKEEFTSSPKDFKLTNASINNGVIELKGNGTQFDNFMSLTQPISVGQGVLTLFKIEPTAGRDQWWLIDLYTRNGTEYYASIGFSEWYHPFTDIAGQGSDTSFTGSQTPPQSYVWYYSFFAITSNDKIEIAIWERDNPNKLSRHTWKLSSNLSNRVWYPGYSGHTGTLYIDSVTLISNP